ncbi:hypothetical protein TD95_001588 [Thielaviopsis punctulata]|uniref:Signal peptidase complex subunit 1 n=1 Tax=Thielaviopsis punctulata TaxID=72032 RepID=A0A0F4ZFY0_9PEZI|nr:hypothetical protein TD95_001588 [Thielaviopsis punctulata]
MAEEFLDNLRDTLDGQIFIAFVYGYMLQDIRTALFIILAGAVITMLLVVPPWSFYKKNPVKWLPVGTGIQTYESLLAKAQ